MQGLFVKIDDGFRSLGHIFLFTINKANSCIGDMPSELIDIAYLDLDATFAESHVPADVLLYIDDILNVRQKGQELFFSIMTYFCLA